MNNIHDMGGFTQFGPIPQEKDEPVFHADWERKVFAMNIASLAFLGPVDRARHAVEKMNTVEYLNSSYYERWLRGIEIMGKDLGYLSDEEIATGKVIDHKEMPHPPPNAEMVEGLIRGGAPATREDGRLEPAFSVGDKVRVRNLESKGHSRATNYVKGKVGVITKFSGSHLLPDSHAHDLGDNAQPLYSVRFEAKTLWGENVDRKDCVYIDLWEDYLEAAK
jgi:nitrile hydratase beta subunit